MVSGRVRGRQRVDKISDEVVADGGITSRTTDVRSEHTRFATSSWQHESTRVAAAQYARQILIFSGVEYELASMPCSIAMPPLHRFPVSSAPQSARSGRESVAVVADVNVAVAEDDVREVTVVTVVVNGVAVVALIVDVREVAVDRVDVVKVLVVVDRVVVDDSEVVNDVPVSVVVVAESVVVVVAVRVLVADVAVMDVAV